MASMLDMSLDDIVKENRGSQQKRGLPRQGRQKPTGGFSNVPMRRQMVNFNTRRGATDERKFDWDMRRKGIQNVNLKRQNGFRNFNRPYNGPDRSRWFQNGQGNRPIRRLRNRAQNIVKVSNLDYGIMEEDLVELFSSVGEVVKVWIDYDRTDRSEGTGGCIFKTHEDARNAIESYNGCRIEGIPIHLEMLSSGENTPRGPLNCPW